MKPEYGSFARFKRIEFSVQTIRLEAEFFLACF